MLGCLGNFGPGGNRGQTKETTDRDTCTSANASSGLASPFEVLKSPDGSHHSSADKAVLQGPQEHQLMFSQSSSMGYSNPSRTPGPKLSLAIAPSLKFAREYDETRQISIP